MNWHCSCPGGPSCPREEEVSPQSFFVSLHRKDFCHSWKALGRHHRLQLQEGAHCQGLSGAEVLPGIWNNRLGHGGEGECVAELDERGKSCWEARSSVLCSLWEAARDGNDPGPGSSGIPAPAAPPPLSGQVLSWPVDADPEENAGTKGKARRGLQKDDAKVGCWERMMSKHQLSCKNNDGGTRALLLGQFGVSESPLHPKPFTKVPPCYGRKAAVVLHTSQSGCSGGQGAGLGLLAV